MISLYEATDSSTRVTLPRTLYSHLTPQLYPSTIGGKIWTSFITVAEVSLIVEPVLKTLDETKDMKVKEDAKRLVLTIIGIINELKKLGIDFNNLPSLQAENIDDGSVLIEWIFNDFRVGFTIEKNKDESGWYLVTTKKLGFINASGYFLDTEKEKLLIWLVSFVTANY